MIETYSFHDDGRRYDEKTGLYYYRARYYHPGLGRFLQTDPIGYDDNMNMYSYVGNDPMNATDPTGLAKEGEGGALLGIVIGGVIEGLWTGDWEKASENVDRRIRAFNGGGRKKNKVKAKGRRKQERRKANEKKHGDADYEEPASEDYAKWKAKQAEKAKGKDGRRKIHDDKKAGEGDRTKEQLEEDLVGNT